MFKINFKNDKDLGSYKIKTDVKFLKDPDFLCIVGSELYGTEDKGSDVDIRGFVFMPKEYLLGVKKFGEHETLQPNHEGDDVVIWSAEKFTKMLLKGSSVAFEMLFCPKDKIIHKSDDANKLLNLRYNFISRRYYTACIGYAQNEWRKVIGEVTRDLGRRRKEDIDKFGYSIRNAYHAIRILDMAIELYEEGTIKFPRGIKHFLRNIKRGQCGFKQAEEVYLNLWNQLDKIIPKVDKRSHINYINDTLADINLNRLMNQELKGKELNVEMMGDFIEPLDIPKKDVNAMQETAKTLDQCMKKAFAIQDIHLPEATNYIPVGYQPKKEVYLSEQYDVLKDAHCPECNTNTLVELGGELNCRVFQCTLCNRTFS